MGRWSRLLAPALVAFSEVRDDDAVLDVGAGTGALAFAVRDATRRARITGVERSETYVLYATEKSSDPRVHFEVGDAQQLHFPDATFDKTLSLLVLNFIPDPARALGEMLRVTRPDGFVTAAVWDYGEGMEMLRAFWDEARACDPVNEALDEARMPLCKRGELAALWQRAGLKDVRETPLTVRLQFASFDDYWAPFLLGQGPAGAFVTKLAPGPQAELGRRLRARLLRSNADRALAMDARAWAVKGTVPRR